MLAGQPRGTARSWRSRLPGVGAQQLARRIGPAALTGGRAGRRSAAAEIAVSGRRHAAVRRRRRSTRPWPACWCIVCADPRRAARAADRRGAVCAGADRRLSCCRRRSAATPTASARSSPGRWRRACSRRARAPPRRAVALLVLAPFLLYWQANAPVADFTAAASDPAVDASYYSAAARRAAERWASATEREPARIEVVRQHRPLGGALGGAARDAGPRLGAPARHAAATASSTTNRSALTAQSYRAWLNHEGRLLRRAAGRAGRTTRPSRRGGAAARAGRAPTCAKSGARDHWRLFEVLDPQPAGERARRLTPREQRLVDAVVPAAGRLHGARALHALLGDHRRRRLRGEAPRRTGRDAGHAAPASCTCRSASRWARLRPFDRAAVEPSARLDADGRPRSSPAGARPAARLAGRAAADLALRCRLPRLPARARYRRERRQRRVRARRRPDRARARPAPVRRALDPGVGLGQPHR